MGIQRFAPDASTPGGWARSATVTVHRVGADGAVSAPTPFAELFLGNARYGRARLGNLDHGAEGMVGDRDGRLFVATRLGVQVFDPGGRLLGVVTLPALPLERNPKRPLSCTFGGSGMATLYVTCGDRVYAVETRTAGVPLPELWPRDPAE